MSLPMALALSALLASSADPLDNLDFGSGKVIGWDGEGFTPAVVGKVAGVTSAEAGTGLLYRSFIVPRGAGYIRFSAQAPQGAPENDLNIFLEVAGRKFAPKLVRTAKGFERTATILPPQNDRPREYAWSIADRVGEAVRIILIDRDDRPGFDLVTSGFRLESADAFDSAEFSRRMNRLVLDHKLSPMDPPHRTRHFLAIANAEEGFVRSQLEQCELMHDQFLAHFRGKGFKLKTPPSRLMVAVFETPEGLEAYMGGPLPVAVTGVYHPASNRLVMYDFGRNRGLEARKGLDREMALRAQSDLERQWILGQMNRLSGELRADANLSTVMHETAHLMAFNTGLLDREGDLSLWLVEGMATYCESTDRGYWKGIGEPNPERLAGLRAARDGKLKLLPLRTLVENDQWLRGPDGYKNAAVGYAQSWALFRMLMEEEPRSLRRYCELIHGRRTPEHRLADFGQAFGSDLAKLDKRHRDYIARLLEAR